MANRAGKNGVDIVLHSEIIALGDYAFLSVLGAGGGVLHRKKYLGVIVHHPLVHLTNKTV